MKNLAMKLYGLVHAYQQKIQLHRLYKKYATYTMIPRHIFVDNLSLIKRLKVIPKGDVVECGVWRGGMIAAIAEILGKDRCYHLLDSFEGLPPVQEEKDGRWAKEWQQRKDIFYFDNCKAPESYAMAAMQMAACTHYQIHKGWFADTLPKFPDVPIALLRLDGDWYDSTYQCLQYLYPKVAKHGLIIVDDYYMWEGCIRAIYDYFSQYKITDRIRSTPHGVCYIIKEETFPMEYILRTKQEV